MEDKIYSRRRIPILYCKIPNQNPQNKKRNRNTLTFAVIIVIAIITANRILQAIEPIIDSQCETMAKSIATKISNEQATIVMKKYQYTDLCTVTKDSNGNITMVSANVIPVNEIISDVPNLIQDELNKTENAEFSIHLGSFLGSKLLAGRGPKIKAKMSTIGSVLTDLKSEFTSAGINQTVHRIYLEVTCKVQVLTPFHTKEEEIINQVLIAEAVIVGTTPDTYYNLEGMKTEDVIEIVE